ncbi:MAG: biopolymer transporter ExbD [Verrucomicrobiota bacterium]|jgi:ribosomal 50S subunit-recycling heat shock protein|nr:biopolymer transporter ExbD [Verrucomicrobiota bacterium]MDP7049798.1 biopolymer transporter ExbD [Verrucomicrobiota bacterium]
MNHHGDIRPIHGRLDVAAFVGVFFLMLPLLLFHTSLVFKPGIEVSADRIRTMSLGEDDIDLPLSSQRTGVGDPSLAVAVDANGYFYFRGGTPLKDYVFPLSVREEDETFTLEDLLVNSRPDLDHTIVRHSVEQGRVRLNGRPARLDDQLKAGQQLELELPSTELLRPRLIQAIEEDGKEPGEISLLIQADKDVSHGLIVRLCALAGEIGVGRVLLASRPPDFSRPFAPPTRTEP